MVEESSELIQICEGLTKKILVKGDADDKPEEGQEVLVNYEGRLVNGTIFDSSYDREALKVNIGTGQVIKGWDQGIMTMTLGEKAELTIASDLAYGDVGSPPTIPPKATLIFTVELIQISDRRPTRWMMSDPELLAAAMRLKDDATARFKLQEFKAAEGNYRDALAHLETVKNDNKDLQDLKRTILQNLGVVSNKTGDYKETIRHCTRALEIDPKAMKALSLRSTAYDKTQNFDAALDDCKAAIHLAPQDKALRTQLEQIKKNRTAKAQSQQAAMQKFFSQGVYNEKEVAKVAQDKNGLPPFNPENPQVFFDLSIGEEGADDYRKERVVFELFKDVPKTCENFRSICTGEHAPEDPQMCYRGNKFHRVITGFMMQGGDTTMGNGTGGKSIYGDKFDDEQIWYPHTHKGVLSMANAGANTNGSQFFLCFGATPHLNNKHTIFGRVIHNYDMVEAVEANPTGAQDKPLKPVTIVDCGELKGEDLLSAEQCDFLASYSA